MHIQWICAYRSQNSQWETVDKVQNKQMNEKNAKYSRAKILLRVEFEVLLIQITVVGCPKFLSSFSLFIKIVTKL